MEIWSRRSSGTGQLLCCLEWFVYKRAHRSGDAAQSAVAGHVMKEEPSIGKMQRWWSNRSTSWQRCTLEAWYIQSEQQRMNTDQGPLSHSHTPHCLFGQSYCMSLVTSTDSRNWSWTESEYLNSISLYSQLLFKMYFCPMQLLLLCKP